MTELYNRFNDARDLNSDIQALRDLQVELDHSVAAVYGWTDLNLAHGFFQTRRSPRFTISDEARQTIVARLLVMNHERYADEVRRGLHEKAGSPWPRDDEETADESLSNEEEQG